MLRRSATAAGVRSELGRQASHQCHGEKVQPLHLLLSGFQAGRSQSIPYGRQLLSSRASVTSCPSKLQSGIRDHFRLSRTHRPIRIRSVSNPQLKRSMPVHTSLSLLPPLRSSSPLLPGHGRRSDPLEVAGFARWWPDPRIAGRYRLVPTLVGPSIGDGGGRAHSR